jgi:hypothetical protein
MAAMAKKPAVFLISISSPFICDAPPISQNEGFSAQEMTQKSTYPPSEESVAGANARAAAGSAQRESF